MSDAWWREGGPARRGRRLGRFRLPPATLYHLEDPVRAEAGRAVRIPGPSAATACPCQQGLRVETPVVRRGFVKRWRVRSVDLRRLLYSPSPTSERPRSGPGAAQAEGVAAIASGARLAREELRRRLLVALQPPPELLLGTQGPLAWPGPLFGFQLIGVRALLHAPGLLLADEMGLGKTVQVIAALRLLCHRGESARALVVVPASVLTQWQREFARWAPELRVLCAAGDPDERRWQWQYRAHVTLTSYETLRADAGASGRGPLHIPWDVVVLDEAQKIKNREAELARVCKRLPRRRAWALSGTPLENRAHDVASLLEFVTAQTMPTDGPALQAALTRWQLRRRKVDVLRDLPPKLITDLSLPMSAAQRRAYDRAARDGLVALRNLEEVRVEHVLALLTRLKQLCNFGPTGESAKLEDLRERLAELTAEGHQALVFSQFADDRYGARRIAAGLRRFDPLVYTGDLDARERREVVERFQRGDRPVLLLSLLAGGQGLNLQCASYVFHFDRWWNPARERQAEDRTHRIGQLHPVHVYRYQLLDTIEQQIHQLLETKTALFTRIVDTASLDISQMLEQSELYGLLGLESE